ncbi:heavy metal translocating P-type ATPase [Kitasatospora sp. GAS204B]|uniref:heavy metal translocating P-type ATPase n=1 Tax=unclassified Kitasatospora TaxID=2633591 RepID=UPI00247714A9|nr:heavy metal translocating P-type ATPase [Kitasatospora sp. GAS204B]MDH6122809.1 Cu+-exporting ATPase [Kitasatospora sp. GAS204B]
MSVPAAGSAPAGAAQELVTTDLAVGGMTCAACVSRVEKKLARLDGVSAGVNLATGRARVLHPVGVRVEELVAAVQSAGCTAEPLAERAPAAATVPDADERLRLVLVAVFAVPVIAVSMVPALQVRGWQWACFASAAFVVTIGSSVFHARAWRALRHANATMDTLVSLGVLASFGWSTYALLFGGAGTLGMRMPFSLTAEQGGGAHIYLEAAVGVPLFVLCGRFLEGRVRVRTGSALRALAELGAKEVCLREDGLERLVPIEQLLPGGEFVVRPGERVATDGVVVEGDSALDVSLLTGESVPVEVGPGERVSGGTLNVDGTLVVRATAVGADTQLARITALVSDAQAGKARAQRLADTVAGVFVPVVLGVAVCVLGFWLGTGAGSSQALTASVAVLVVACPCALGLATPTALLAATGRGAELGVLVRGPEVLESLRRIDTVVLDKTGTLTAGQMTLACGTAAKGFALEEVLRLAGALEQRSEHPLARALVTAAGPSLPAVSGFRARPGLGVEGTVEGVRVRVVRPDTTELPRTLREALTRAEAAGQTAVVAEVDGRAAAVLAVGDSLRPGSYRAVHRLRAMGLETVLATGDQAGAARAVAEELGISEVHAGASPERKAELVAQLRAAGRSVAVVGDGVNDAVALASADLGIALGSGTDAAIGAAGLTLVRGDIESLVVAVRLARRTAATIRANLAWAFGYNAVLIPLAAAGLLNPMIAALAMSASSVLVVGNSLRLRTWQPARRGRGRSRPGG